LASGAVHKFVNWGTAADLPCCSTTAPVVRIAITQAALDAIAKTLPLGSVGYENASQREGRAPDLAGHGGGG
jgi:hypothetical protein